MEEKWHFYLKVEKEIRESTLASLFPDLTKSQVVNVVKMHNNKFKRKYREFSILQNKIEEVVQKSTRFWKTLYKKTDDVFDEEYKAKASAKPEERRKKREEKKEVEKNVEEEKKVEEERKGEEINKGDE